MQQNSIIEVQKREGGTVMKYTTEEALAQIHMRQTSFREKMRIGVLLLVVFLVVLFGLQTTRN